MINQEKFQFLTDADIIAGTAQPELSDRPTNPEKTFDNELMKKVARQIVEESLRVEPGHKVLIQVHSTGWQLASAVMEAARAKGTDDRPVEILLKFNDKEITELQLESVESLIGASANDRSESVETYSTEEMHQSFIQHDLLNEVADDLIWADKILIIRSTVPLKSSPEKTQEQLVEELARIENGEHIDEDPYAFKVDGQVRNLYNEAASYLTDVRVDEKEWCLIYVPTEAEAKAAKMSFDKYARFYYEACDMDWPAIEAAQDVLIDILAQGKEITVKAPPAPGMSEDWYTDVTMNIEGKIGANSTIRRNLPGSEVFLAPNAGTLNGRYSIGYPVLFGGRVLSNLRLDFEAGKVVNFYIESESEQKQQEYMKFVEKILATDEGARSVGELGIGTNSEIKKAYTNTLLVEKAKGIHLALGNAYAATEYFGKKIKVDNGNRSKIHIDLTLMMIKEFGGGEMILDGKVIQKDGDFLDERLAVLNDGRRKEANQN